MPGPSRLPIFVAGLVTGGILMGVHSAGAYVSQTLASAVYGISANSGVTIMCVDAAKDFRPVSTSVTAATTTAYTGGPSNRVAAGTATGIHVRCPA